MVRALGRWLTVALIAAAALAVAPATQASGPGDDFVTLVSLRHFVPATPADDGASKLWRSGEATIEVTGSPSSGVTVSVHHPGVDPTVLTFAAPVGESLHQGVYDDAVALSHRSALRPGVEVDHDTNCTREYGRFSILDMAPDLSRLELTYEIHCTSEYEAVFGQVHVGEPADPVGLIPAPDHVDWPSSYPGVASTPVPITLVNTGDRALTIRGATVAGDPSFFLANDPCATVDAGSTCQLYVGFKPTTASAQSGALTFTDSTGTGTRRVTLAGRGTAGHTSWRMNSDPGDYIGAGASYDFTPATSMITAEGNQSEVRLRADGPNGMHWDGDFAADPAHPLLPGTTYRAIGFPFNGDQPGMDVSGDGRGGYGTGVFTVHEATYDSEGNVTSFSVTFEQHDSNAAPALFGSIAWKAKGPAAPVPHGKTSAPVSSLRAIPSTGSAVLSWMNPTSSYWSHTVVRRAQGLRAPSVTARGLPEYSGRADALVSQHLLAETSYTWTVYPVYGNGSHAPPVHITLRGSRLTGHVVYRRPAGLHEFRYSGRLLDAQSRRPLVGKRVEIYTRAPHHHWKWLTGEITGANGGFTRHEQMLVGHRQWYKAVYDGGGNHLGSSSDPSPVKRR